MMIFDEQEGTSEKGREILKKCLSKSGCHGNVKLNRQGLVYQIVCR